MVDAAVRVRCVAWVPGVDDGGTGGDWKEKKKERLDDDVRRVSYAYCGRVHGTVYVPMEYSVCTYVLSIRGFLFLNLTW